MRHLARSSQRHLPARALLTILALTGTLALTACAAAPTEIRAASSDAPEAPLPKVSVPGQPTLAPLMRRVTPAVVSISVDTKPTKDEGDFFDDPEFRRFLDQVGLPHPQHPPLEKQKNLGSGVIVDAARGYVMTNDHLLQNATRILVTLKDRRSFRAKRLRSDPATDIAILEIPPVDVRALALGNSDRLEVGDFVIAIGNPFGLGQTVTMGIVSAVGRSAIAGNHLGELIQTDASINPGNSGGPLINLAGEVVGINTALIGPSGGNVGIGFAMPSNRSRAALNGVMSER